MPSKTREMTYEEWMAEGTKRFGSDQMDWRFVCPSCGHVATAHDYKAAGARESTVAFSCVGRWIEGSRSAFEDKGTGPCTYAGGGLFRLNPVTVRGPGDAEHQMFEFAEPDRRRGRPRSSPRVRG